MRKLQQCIISALLLFIIILPLQAQDAEALTEAVQTLIQLSSFVEASVQFCNEQAPEVAVSVQNAAAVWHANSKLELLDPIRNFSVDGKSIFADMEAILLQESLQDLKSRASSRALEWCQHLPTLLQQPEWNIPIHYSNEIALLTSLNEMMAGQQDTASFTSKKQTLPSMKSPNYNQIIAQGIDPKKQFIQDEFRCYEEREGSDYDNADMVLQILAGGQYRSSYGNGSYSIDLEEEDIVWQSGPLAEAFTGWIRFNDYGQEFPLRRVELEERHDFNCYQQGASEQHALTKFRLKEPQIGNYICRDTEGSKLGMLELSGSHYSINGQSGTYKVDLRSNDNDRSRINWISGPFKEQRSFYEEEEGTGYRELNLSISDTSLVANAFTGGVFVGGSSSLEAVCSSIGEAVHFQKYGNEVAPPPPEKAGGLSGFFIAHDPDFKFMGKGPSDYIFYTFFPKGYVYTEEPEAKPAEVDCKRTKPNGAPLCEIYIVRGNTITIGIDKPVSFAKQENKLIIDEKELLPVPADIASLSGRFWANAGETVGVCGPYSYCSSWYKEKIFTFTSDGHFLDESSSKSLSSLDSALGSSHVSASGNEENSGTYYIKGNFIELRYNNGRVEQQFITIFDSERFHMGGWSFSPKKDE